jgi:hypothetical protein
MKCDWRREKLKYLYRKMFDWKIAEPIGRRLRGRGRFRGRNVRDTRRVSGLSNRQIHEDLGVPLFADHIRDLTESFDSKLADVGNPLVRQLGRYLS